MPEGRSVLVVLDRERHLRYDFNALVDLEQALGITLAQIPQTTGALGLTHLRAFMWPGLRHEDDALTVRTVGTLIQAYLDGGGDLVKLSGLMREALALAGYQAPGAAPSESGAAPLAPAGSATPSS